MITVGFHSDAERELNDAVSFYEALQPGLGKALIYSHDSTQAIILAVAHHRRRPGYWKTRQP